MQPGAGCHVVIHVEHDADVAGVRVGDVDQNSRQVVLQAVAAVQLYSLDMTETLN